MRECPTCAGLLVAVGTGGTRVACGARVTTCAVAGGWVLECPCRADTMAVRAGLTAVSCRTGVA